MTSDQMSQQEELELRSKSVCLGALFQKKSVLDSVWHVHGSERMLRSTAITGFLE